VVFPVPCNPEKVISMQDHEDELSWKKKILMQSGFEYDTSSLQFQAFRAQISCIRTLWPFLGLRKIPFLGVSQMGNSAKNCTAFAAMGETWFSLGIMNYIFSSRKVETFPGECS